MKSKFKRQNLVFPVYRGDEKEGGSRDCLSFDLHYIDTFFSNNNPSSWHFISSAITILIFCVSLHGDCVEGAKGGGKSDGKGEINLVNFKNLLTNGIKNENGRTVDFWPFLRTERVIFEEEKSFVPPALFSVFFLLIFSEKLDY